MALQGAGNAAIALDRVPSVISDVPTSAAGLKARVKALARSIALSESAKPNGGGRVN